MILLARTRGIRTLLWRRDWLPASRDVAQGRAAGTDEPVRGEPEHRSALPRRGPEPGKDVFRWGQGGRRIFPVLFLI